MALIICPECGQEVSEKAASCPNCGCPIALSPDSTNSVVASEQILTTHVKKKSKKPLVVCLIALVLGIAFSAWLYVSRFSPEAKLNKAFNEAVLLYNNGQFAEALPCFEALGDYSNSADHVNWCKYEIAQTHLSNSNWESAVAYLSGINYKNSEELILYCRYNQGVSAMECFDWETAISYFTDLNYENSDNMLTDCTFMVTLEESVLRRIEASTKELLDSRSLITTELAYLEEFKDATFYDSTINAQAEKYIGGLETQLDGLTYEFYNEYQRDWHTGLVARYEALNSLYLDYHFMADNKDFIGHYINQLEYWQKWLAAFTELEKKGFEDDNWSFGRNYVEIRFKNNTPYATSIVFDFAFYTDETKAKQVGTTTVFVDDVRPYAEYTVRAYYPPEAHSAGWVEWHNYYQEIKIE